MNPEPLIVIGAGHAGAELCVQAREAGWAGAIAVVGEEPHLPYHRPPLSKAYLAGSADAASLALRPMASYAKAAVDLKLGRRVTTVERGDARVRLDDGTSLPYGRLVLATGGRPRRLPAADELDAPAAVTNLHYVRTRADIDGLRERFRAGARLVIVGGGYIGLEVAAVAVKAGLTVTVLEGAERVLARVTAPVVASFYEAVHRAAGVDVRCGLQVTSLELDPARERVAAVHCSDSEAFACDLVVVGIGLVPNTELAESAGLAVRDGILVDALLRTDDPAILAVGDCTRFHSALYDRSIRLESVPSALEQARAAAQGLAGKPAAPPAVPWFWSDQYELKLKMVGLSQGYDRLVLRGAPERQSFSAFYLQGTRVLAVDTVNRIAEFTAAKRLVQERIEVDPARLADDAVPLKDQLPAPAGKT